MAEYDVKQKLARAEYQAMRLLKIHIFILHIHRFYSYNCNSPYEHLSAANTMIEKLEVQVRELL